MRINEFRFVNADGQNYSAVNLLRLGAAGGERLALINPAGDEVASWEHRELIGDRSKLFIVASEFATAAGLLHGEHERLYPILAQMI